MHGPKPRSHAFKLNKKVRRLGLKIALSARAAEGKASLHFLCVRHEYFECLSLIVTLCDKFFFLGQVEFMQSS